MAENTTSITVKVDIDVDEFKQKIHDTIYDATKAAVEEVFKLFGVSTPVVEAEVLAVGDRVKLVGNRRIGIDKPDADWSHWEIGRGDVGVIEGIDEDGDADVRFDTGAYFVALTSLEKIQ